MTEGQNADAFNFAKGTLSGRNASSYQTNHFHTEAFVNFVFCANIVFRLFNDNQTGIRTDFM